MGPTASGKSALALALAEHLPIDIVSVDASQVYQGMDIGTAKPSEMEKQHVPHHLIDILPPSASYSVSQFVSDATAVSTQLLKNKRLPCLVGGTMLYFKALQSGLSQLPDQDKIYRKQLEEEAQKIGWNGMHRKLKEVDPLSASRIHPNDPQRIQRALEVYHLTGKAMSELWQSAEFDTPPFDFINIALMPDDRNQLHQQIAARFDMMLEAGFIEEVQRLKSMNIDPGLPSMRTVGYRQALCYLNGEYDFDTMREKAIVATRQLAKRQMTWLRSWPNATYFSPEDPALLEKVLTHIHQIKNNHL